MYKRFLNKIIREKKYPRCHYTRKKNKWKPKFPYNSANIAYIFIKERHLINYDVYRCPEIEFPLLWINFIIIKSDMK